MLVGHIYFNWVRFSWQIADAVVEGSRPTVPYDDTYHDYSELTSECWQPNPQARPPFEQIYDRLCL
jgi:hypothetical protein